MNVWEKSTPDRGHSKCKVLVAGAYLSCSKKGREASVSGWRERGKKMEEEVSDVIRDQVTEGLMEHGKGFRLHS